MNKWQWFGLALGVFLGNLISAPLFRRTWKDGFYIGCIAFALTMLAAVFLVRKA